MNSYIPEGVRYFDISPLVSSRIAVFPEDTNFSRDIALDFEKGNNLLLSSIRTTLHLGAHADAPNHYHADGVGIDQRGLSFYMGKAQVISVKTPKGQRIDSSDIKDFAIKAPRVLFKTNSFPNPDQWNGDFCTLSSDLIYTLADQGVRLVGIDTPSVDPADSKALESHNAIYQRQMAILEGIVLTEVPDGLYTLIALPLRLEDGDASPVRAILLEH
jgi:arylformamidase